MTEIKSLLLYLLFSYLLASVAAGLMGYLNYRSFPPNTSHCEKTTLIHKLTPTYILGCRIAKGETDGIR